jgi:hypothetical protein
VKPRKHQSTGVITATTTIRATAKNEEKTKKVHFMFWVTACSRLVISLGQRKEKNSKNKHKERKRSH